MATYKTTLANANTPPVGVDRSGQVVEVGLNYNSGATTLGPKTDTIQLCKVPNHSWITDIHLVTSTSATGFTMALGTSSDADAFATGVADGSVVSHANILNVLPYHIDLTDTATDQFVYVQLSAGATGSSVPSVSVNFSVRYFADRDND